MVAKNPAWTPRTPPGVVTVRNESKWHAEKTGNRFVEVGLRENRFVSVKDGQKKCLDHDTRYNDPDQVPGQNYGIYADQDDQLVILDVDYYEAENEEGNTVSLAALGALPRTLKIKSPHVPEGDRGGHRIFKLAGEETPAELFKRRLGTANPVPSWGEVVAKNKYVVAPGSELSECDKDFHDCSEPGEGLYEIKKNREIAEVEPETLIEALAADPDVSDVEAAEQSQTLPGAADSDDSEDVEGDYPEFDQSTVTEMLAKIPGDQHFDDWIRTGYAVYDWDSGQRGKAVFEDWSKSNPKWEREESQRQIDYIWQNGESGDKSDRNASVGTLVHLAKKHGWNPGGPTPRELVVEYSDKFDDPSEVPASLVAGSESALGGGSDDDVSQSEESGDGESAGSADSQPDWGDVRMLYDMAKEEDNFTKGSARQRAADVLEASTAWMYVLESQRLWVYDDETGVFDRFGEAAAASVLVENLGEHYSQTERREIIGQLEDRNQTHREKLNARGHDDPLVCVGNGVINLETGDLKDHSPHYHFVRGLRWDYDPDRANPEPVLKFLDDVTERKADRDTLIDHLAHGLMPGHPFRAFVVAYGPGGNGKTQVAELFRGFVGEENSAAVEIDELTDDDFATGDLPGKFLNWGDDMAGDGGGTLQELSLLKKATGGSKIRANEKFEKTFDFTNEAAMFFSANEPPRIGERKRSMMDRIYPIEMPYKFVSDPEDGNPMEKQKVPNVSGSLLEDDSAMRGLLSLAVDHAKKLLATRGEYSQPEGPEDRLAKYNQSADPIVRFAGRALEPADANSLIRKDDVYRVYRAFVESWGERGASERGFKRQLPKAFTEEIESARSRALATHDDEKERVVCWKRLTWTETALAQMPDWMVDRYQDHFEDSENSDKSNDDNQHPAARENGTIPLSNVEDAYNGPASLSIQVRVTATVDPKPWLEAEGTVEDESAKIDFQARAGLPADAEGQEFIIRNVRLTRGEFDELQLEFRPDTEFVEVSSIPDDQQRVSAPVADGGDSTTSTPKADGFDVPADAEGSRANARRAAAALAATDADALDRESLRMAMVNEHPAAGLQPQEMNHGIDAAVTEYGLLVEEDGSYRRP